MKYVEPIRAFIRKNPIEIGLISLAILFSIISFIPRSHTSDQDVRGATTIQPTPKDIDVKEEISEPLLLVEVSGAVLYPDVYLVAPGTHMKEVVDMAGGLTDMADRLYVGRNYNLARLVGDQEKIYIPYMWDIQNGTFYEQNRVLEYLQPLYQTPSTDSTSSLQASSGQALTKEGGGSQASSLQISINEASPQELDTLPGVGPVTAQKIVDSRPYSSIDELLSRKVVNQSAFESLKELIKL